MYGPAGSYHGTPISARRTESPAGLNFSSVGGCTGARHARLDHALNGVAIYLIRIHDGGQFTSIVTAEVLDCAGLDTFVSVCARSGYQAPLQPASGRGRPSYVVGRDQLVYFIEHGFTAQQMSNTLGVSVPLT